MKVLTTAGLTELIQLSKNTFLDKNNTVDMSTIFATVATTGNFNDLSNKPVVDQTYSASSTNAQSGTAVASAISGKQATITGAATTITTNNLTTNRVLISNASGKVAVSDITSTELGYLDNVTSNIQTQLNAKAPDNNVVHLDGAETITGTKTFTSTLELKQNLSFRSYGSDNSGRLQFRAQPADNVIRGTVAITDGYSTTGSGYNGFVVQMVARAGSTSSDPFNTMRVSNKGIEYIKEANNGTITGQYIVVNSDGLVPSERLATSGSTGQVLTKTASGQSWQTFNALPSQTSQSGKFLTTNGTTASWANIPTEIPSQSGNSGKYLTTNGTSVSWATVDVLPSQSGKSGKFLTTNGTTASWVDAPTEIPTQTGNSGKFLTTNGSAVSWATVDALPSQSGNNGKFLTTNGSAASWASLPTVDQTYSGTSTNAQSGTAVKQAIDAAVSSVYKPAGSVAFANRPSLSSSIEGNVYNITDAFTTTSDFVEGAGKSYPAGTNIVCINTATSGTAVYKWDVLTGMVDLSGYQTTITGGATTITSSNLTASRALVSNSSGKVAVSSVTSTELGYVSGVTSAIQTQLNNKQATLTSGTNIKTINNTSVLGSGNIDTHELPSQTGNSGKFLTTNGTAVSWAQIPAPVTFRTWS